MPFRSGEKSLSILNHFHQTVRVTLFSSPQIPAQRRDQCDERPLDKAAVDEVLEKLGHGETTRAEQLSVEQIQQLAEALRLAEQANV